MRGKEREWAGERHEEVHGEGERETWRGREIE